MIGQPILRAFQQHWIPLAASLVTGMTIYALSFGWLAISLGMVAGGAGAYLTIQIIGLCASIKSRLMKNVAKVEKIIDDFSEATHELKSIRKQVDDDMLPKLGKIIDEFGEATKELKSIRKKVDDDILPKATAILTDVAETTAALKQTHQRVAQDMLPRAQTILNNIESITEDTKGVTGSVRSGMNKTASMVNASISAVKQTKKKTEEVYEAAGEFFDIINGSDLYSSQEYEQEEVNQLGDLQGSDPMKSEKEVSLKPQDQPAARSGKSTLQWLKSFLYLEHSQSDEGEEVASVESTVSESENPDNVPPVAEEKLDTQAIVHAYKAQQKKQARTESTRPRDVEETKESLSSIRRSHPSNAVS